LVFRDMPAVPPPSESTEEGERELPIIDIHGSAEDLEVLRMIYPAAFPPITDLNALSKTFVILDKYHTEELRERLKPFLISSGLLATDPMCVYAITCRWGFKTEAAIAAPYASAIGISAFTCMDDMRYIPAPTTTPQHFLPRSEEKSIPCNHCPRTFYDNFRSRLAERLLVGSEMFRDFGTCTEVCFDVAKETKTKHETANCMRGGSHLEQFVVSLMKSLRNIPTSQNAAA
jgi:hypothetical protein